MTYPKHHWLHTLIIHINCLFLIILKASGISKSWKRFLPWASDIQRKVVSMISHSTDPRFPLSAPNHWRPNTCLVPWGSSKIKGECKAFCTGGVLIMVLEWKLRIHRQAFHHAQGSPIQSGKLLLTKWENPCHFEKKKQKSEIQSVLHWQVPIINIWTENSSITTAEE